MNIPLETLVNAGIVLIFLLFWLLVFIILYHLTRFGVGLLPKRLAALFLVGSVVLFLALFLSYFKLDLSALRSFNL